MREKKKPVLFSLTLVMVALILTGCIPGDGSYDFENPAGFLSGVWHGWIAPLSLIIGIFSDNVRVYEVFNTGWWYDFGFYIAVISGFGGLSLSRKKKKDE